MHSNTFLKSVLKSTFHPFLKNVFQNVKSHQFLVESFSIHFIQSDYSSINAIPPKLRDKSSTQKSLHFGQLVSILESSDWLK